MFDSYLVPANTVVTTKGDGLPVALEATTNRIFLVVLQITNIVEQEALDISIWGSPDGQTWSAKLLTFPQRFYPGDTPLILDLTGNPEVKFVRAHWEVNRWGRGLEQPMFELNVRIREIPSEILVSANS